MAINKELLTLCVLRTSRLCSNPIIVRIAKERCSSFRIAIGIPIAFIVLICLLPCILNLLASITGLSVDSSGSFWDGYIGSTVGGVCALIAQILTLWPSKNQEKRQAASDRKTFVKDVNDLIAKYVANISQYHTSLFYEKPARCTSQRAGFHSRVPGRAAFPQLS